MREIWGRSLRRESGRRACRAGSAARAPRAGRRSARGRARARRRTPTRSPGSRWPGMHHPLGDARGRLAARPAPPPARRAAPARVGSSRPTSRSGVGTPIPRSRRRWRALTERTARLCRGRDPRRRRRASPSRAWQWWCPSRNAGGRPNAASKRSSCERSAASRRIALAAPALAPAGISASSRWRPSSTRGLEQRLGLEALAAHHHADRVHRARPAPPRGSPRRRRARSRSRRR